MDETEFKLRTKAFALRVWRLTESLPKGRAADVIARQLFRAATSVGANYRAACRARSNAEFIAKLGIVEEEADESGFWLELIVDGGLQPKERVGELHKECEEIVAMVVASIRTARRRPAQTTRAVQSKIRNPKSKMAAGNRSTRQGDS